MPDISLRRRLDLGALLVAVLWTAPVAAQERQEQQQQRQQRQQRGQRAQRARARPPLWVGTADGSIRVFELSPVGKLTLRHRLDGPKPLAFVAFHPRLPVAYGAVGTAVQTYAVAGGAPLAGAARDAGVRGTHVEVDPVGRFVFLASYGAGAVRAFPLDESGMPGAASFTLRAPQELCRKAHQVRIDPLGRFAYAPCLGDDAIQIMAIGAGGIDWRGRVRLRTGSGPRHMDFSPGSGFAYVLNEIASTVYVYRRDAVSGGLTEVQAISALPAGQTEGSRSADIHVSRDGRFVYAVNREPRDEIVAFAAGKDGRLRCVGRTPTGGVHSRSFVLGDGDGDGGGNGGGNGGGDGDGGGGDGGGGGRGGAVVVLGHSKTQDIVVRRRDPKTGVVGAVVDAQEVGAAAIFVGFAPRW